MKSPADLFARAERDPDRLKEVYAALESLPATEAPPEAPKAKRSGADPWAGAKEVVQPLMKMFLLKAAELSLGPKDLVYAAELFALNVLNAVDYPGPPEERRDAIQAADKYYTESLPKVPLQPPLGQ